VEVRVQTRFQCRCWPGSLDIGSPRPLVGLTAQEAAVAGRENVIPQSQYRESLTAARIPQMHRVANVAKLAVSPPNGRGLMRQSARE
jgi:hypothetical protein